ncbi:hypothetical protein DFH09DRAFT_1170703 [Mycena vulgaris]|nr:hypothetical protein DFH09DRAFT_1170703 [Mycena vulgaris]
MATMTYLPPPGPPPGFHTGLHAPPPGPPKAPTVSVSLGPPPGAYPSCQNATELAAYVHDSLTVLATQGWLSSSTFFDLPSDSPEKVQFAAPAGKAASDEGFSDIAGEKQRITLRRLSGTPPLLRKAGPEAWDATGQLFLETIRGIAGSLELEDVHVFDDMSSEAQGFSKTQRAPSLLRLFRYNRPGLDAHGMQGTKKVVAEGHKDLGILTLVLGQSPGLDARDPATGQWVSVEDAPGGGGGPCLTATLLAGQTLTYLTRGLYASGVHRVSVLPSTTPEDKYRFSLVFALRPSPTSTIATPKFEQSPLTGLFPPERLSLAANNYPNCSMYDQPATELFKCIAQQHWNVNIAPEIREEQKKKLAAEGKTADAAEGTTADADSVDAGEKRLG